MNSIISQGTRAALWTNAADVSIDRSRFLGNEFGIDVNGTNANFSIQDSVLVNNQDGALLIESINSIEIVGTRIIGTGRSTRLADLQFGFTGNRTIDSLVIQDSRLENLKGFISSSNDSLFSNLVVKDSSISVSGTTHRVENSLFISSRTSFFGSGTFEFLNSEARNGSSISAAHAFASIQNSQFTNARGFDSAFRWLITTGDSELSISNSLFNNNQKQGAGGGAIEIRSEFNSNAMINVVSSTFVNNSADSVGGLIGFEAGRPTQLDVSFQNSILWNNQAPRFDLVQADNLDSINVTATNSIIEDERRGDGLVPFGGAANRNLDLFPEFVDRASGDFRLASNSPAINAGANALLVRDTNDLDGDGNTTEFAPDLDLLDRVFNGRVDLGAFEFGA